MRINLRNQPPNFKNKNLKILFFVFWVFIVFFDSTAKGDFEIFIEASKDLLASKNIYTNLYNQYFHYYYSILFALILYPFSFLPFYFVKVFWMICNYFFTYRIYKKASEFLDLKNEDNTSKLNVLIVSFLFVFALWHRNIALAQVTIFVLFLMVESLTLIIKKWVYLPAFILAFGIDFKIMPIVLLPYLFYRGYLKVLFVSVIFLLVLMFIPSLFIGLDNTLYLLSERWKLINPLNSEHVLDVAERSFHSITTFLSVLLVENTNEVYALNLKRNILNVTHKELGQIVLVVRMFFVLLSFVFLRAKFFKEPLAKLDWWYEWSYLFIAIPLVFPHQQHYAFFLLLPAIIYLLYFGKIYYFSGKEEAQKKGKYMYLSAMIFSFLLLSSHFLVGAFREYYDHYKTLTYGVFILIITLALCNPTKLNTKIAT
jgi:hypothetical protein